MFFESWTSPPSPSPPLSLSVSLSLEHSTETFALESSRAQCRPNSAALVADRLGVFAHAGRLAFTPRERKTSHAIAETRLPQDILPYSRRARFSLGGVLGFIVFRYLAGDFSRGRLRRLRGSRLSATPIPPSFRPLCPFRGRSSSPS